MSRREMSFLGVQSFDGPTAQDGSEETASTTRGKV
jgi:hypothetical protein